MNGIVSFRLCTLDDEALLKAVDLAVDEMYQTGKIPSRRIPARPNKDFDLLIGELIVRFKEKVIDKGRVRDISLLELINEDSGALSVRLYNALICLRNERNKRDLGDMSIRDIQKKDLVQFRNIGKKTWGEFEDFRSLILK